MDEKIPLISERSDNTPPQVTFSGLVPKNERTCKCVNCALTNYLQNGVTIDLQCPNCEYDYNNETVPSCGTSSLLNDYRKHVGSKEITR